MAQSVNKWWTLGGILLLAFAIRAVDLNGQSFFIDEFSEVSLAKHTASDIINTADSSPPLFPLVLKYWLAFWGTDDAARWLSVVCGVASVACVWAIGRRLVDNPTGLAAAFVTALLPMHVYYSQFVRNYSLLFLLVACGLWLLLRAIASDRWRDWAAFVAVAILGAYTHYYYVIFLATSVAVVWLWKRHWWFGWRACSAYAALGIAMLPLALLIQDDLGFQKGLREPRSLNVATLGYTYFSLFNGYTLGPSTPELQTMSGAQAVRAAMPWLAAVGVVLLVLGYEGWRRLRNEPSMRIIAVLGVLPVVILGALSLVGGLNYNVRFVTWIMIAAAVWLGAGIAAGWKKWPVRIAVSGFILLSAIAIYNRHAVPRYQNEDLRGVAEYLRATAVSTDNVYIVSDYLAVLLQHYLGDAWHVVELPAPDNVNQVVGSERDAAGALAKISDATSTGKRTWLVYSRPFHGDPHGFLFDAMSPQRRFELATTLAGVTIYVTDPPPAAKTVP